MAIDRRLQIYDEQGNLVDYDILASDVKFLPDGKDLPTKLAEMQDEIDDAGSGDGTVTGVKIGSTTYEPTDGVVDLSSPMGNKVDKNGTDSLMTAAEHTKLAGIAAGAQVNVINSISVNGTPQTPVDGNVNISVQGAAGEDGITPHIGSNGHWYIGETDTGINATGATGSVTITDGDLDTLEVHNALNAYTGLLGMSGAMLIKSNIDSLYTSLNRLYSKLANMAFWDAEDQEDAAPTPVDWSLPQITVTLDKTSLSANAMITDASDQEISGTSVSVDEGSGLTLKIKPRNGYALTASPTATIGGVSQTLTESNGVYTLVLDSVTEAITIVISATAAQARSVTLNLTGCTKTSGPTSIINGGGGTFVFAANEGYTLPTAAPTVVGASIATDGWDSTTGTLVISGVSDNVTITIVATQVQTEQVTLTMKKVTAYGAQYGTLGNGDTNAATSGVTMTLGNLSSTTPECALSNTSYVDGQAFNATVNPASGYAIFSVKVEQNSQDITDTAYNPSTHAISVASPDNTLSITVIVAAVTNGMFKAGSFFGSAEGDMNYFSTSKAGQIVSDPARDSNLAWHCNSEFIAIPQNATHIKWTVTDSSHIPYSSNPTRAAQHQRTLIWYDKNFIPIAFLTYWDISDPFRIWQLSANQTVVSSAKYLRASYVEGFGKIEFSSDGTNFTTAWEYTED